MLSTLQGAIGKLARGPDRILLAEAIKRFFPFCLVGVDLIDVMIDDAKCLDGVISQFGFGISALCWICDLVEIVAVGIYGALRCFLACFGRGKIRMIRRWR